MIRLERGAVADPTPRPGGKTRLGVAQVDLTPELGVPLSGYGPAIAGGGHRWARGLAGRLHATAVVVDPPDGRRLALVAIDLHVASRILTELVAKRTARLGIGPAQVLIGATHTHSGPGHLYGSTYYDAGASNGDRRLDLPLVEELADRVAAAIETACTDAARSADRRLHLGVGVATGAMWNRSFEAFTANWVELEDARDGADDEDYDPELVRRVRDFGEGRGPETLRPLAAELADLDAAALPAETRSSRRWAVNAGIDLISIHEGGGGPRESLVGLLGVVHATPTLMPGDIALVSPDVLGFTAQVIRRRLGREVPIGFMGGALGDVNVVDPTRFVNELRRTLGLEGHQDPPGSPRGREAREALLGHQLAASHRLADVVLEGLDGGQALTGLEVSAVLLEGDDNDIRREGEVTRWDLLSEPLTSDARPRFAAPRPRAGLAIMHGSDLRRSPKPGDILRTDDIDDARSHHPRLRVEERRRGFDDEALRSMLGGRSKGLPWTAMGRAHFPKKSSTVLQSLVTLIEGTRFDSLPKVQPVRAFSLTGASGEGILLLSCPGEASTALGYRIRARLRGLERSPTPASLRVSVVGPSGEYCGYWTTLREYLRQSYEAGGAWWGRDSGPWLEDRWIDAWRHLGTGVQPSLAEVVEFPTLPSRDSGPKRKYPWDDHDRAGAGSALEVTELEGGLLVRCSVGVPADELQRQPTVGAWVRFHHGPTGGRQAPVTFGAVVADDTSVMCLVEVEVSEGRAEVHVTGVLPRRPEWDAGGWSLSVEVLGLPAGEISLPGSA